VVAKSKAAAPAAHMMAAAGALPPPNCSCNAAGVTALQNSTRNGANNLPNMEDVYERLRCLIWCFTNQNLDIFTLSSSDNLPNTISPATLLRGQINAYFNDVGMQISNADLSAATTVGTLAQAVFNAI
jgi:hypothetical protein